VQGQGEGASNFILIKECFRYTQASQPVDTLATQQLDHVDDVGETTIERFEVDDNTNTVRPPSQTNPGTVGTEDNACGIGALALRGPGIDVQSSSGARFSRGRGGSRRSTKITSSSSSETYCTTVGAPS